MKNIILSSVWLLFGAIAVSGQTTDLIISEYVEGSSNNKFVEIYNGTGASVNLNDYRLRLFSNGASSATNDVQLSGVLANGAVIVYQNSSASIYAGTNNAAVSFNGDDAIGLWKISTNSYVDIFGKIGCDPGTSWGGLTVDKTLRRKSNVCSGVTVNPSVTCNSSSFPTLTSEWDDFPIDNISDLGTHTTTCTVVAPCSVATNVLTPAVTNCINGTASLSWTDASCFDEYLVLAKPGASIAVPTGNGTLYTANPAYGSGSAFDGGFIVYKGVGTSVNITGLTNGLNYTYTIFTRKGSTWSSGISVNCTPSMGPCIDEPLQSTSAPAGWTATNITFGTNYAEFTSNNGKLTTKLVSYPTLLTFDLERTSNASPKKLYINVSTTSQSAGFDTLPIVYSHANTTAGGTTSCTVDLSAYSSYPAVYIQFEKVSSTTSPWRLSNVVALCNSSAPVCNTPTHLQFSASSFAPIEQSVIPSFNVSLACSSGINSACNNGTITLTTNGCGTSGTFTKSVVNGVATFDDISFLRSVQSGITFTATYTGSCASSLSATTAPFNVATPPSTPTYNAIKDDNFSVGTPIPWAFTMSTPVVYGTGGSNGNDVSGVVTNGGNSYLRKSYSVNNSSGEKGTTVTFTFDNVVLNPVYSHVFDFKVASIDAAGGMSSGTGVDNTEDLIFEISLDGGATWNTTFTHLGGSDKVFNFSSTPLTTINYDANVSYSSSVNLSNFRVNVPLGSTQFMFRFTASSNRTNENWAVDDLKLQEVIPSNLPHYLPNLALATPVIVCPGSTMTPTYTLTNNFGATTYKWHSNADISNLNVASPIISPSANNQVYTLVITDSHNCKDSSTVTINYPTGNVGEWKGTISEDWFDCRNWGAGFVPDSSTNVIIASGALNACTITDTSTFVTGTAYAYANSISVDNPNLYLRSHAANNVQLYVKSNVVIGSNGRIIEPYLGGSIIKLKGNWTNNNSTLSSADYKGQVQFIGNGVQTISRVGGSEELYDLYVQNPTYISFLSDVNSSKLFMDANIKSNSNLFILGNSNLNSSNLNYISGFYDGKMRRYMNMSASGMYDTYFPLGNTTFDNRLMQIQFSSGGAAGFIDAEYISGAMGGNGLPIALANSGGFGNDINMSESDGYWVIEPDAGVSLFQTTPYTITLHEEGYTSLTNPANATIIKRDDAQSNWQALGNHIAGSNIGSVYTLSRSGLVGFSHFGFGYPDSPLPVTLGSFDLKCKKGEVEIEWTTTQESNSDYFVVQASKDAMHYEDVDKVWAAGNSNSLLSYKSIYSNRDGYNYWRLKQVDYNLDYEIFPASYLNCQIEEAQCWVLQANSTLQLNSPITVPYVWTIYNSTGQLVYTSKVLGSEYVDVWSQLATGVYYIKAYGLNNEEVFKVIKL